MSRIPAFLLAILWMMTPWASAYAYEFPIENRWKATVVGTPPGYRAELPKKIPLKKTPHRDPRSRGARSALA